ncbi:MULTISPECIES: hypothetical protein [unclassified Microcoleus]|uniref:hypothetical protein n=1 Tax=unclassified Microcoleus TaxID=2642155 RepID=UPI002FD088EC
MSFKRAVLADGNRIEVLFSIEVGLAQILAYMLANPNPDKPSYSILTIVRDSFY